MIGTCQSAASDVSRVKCIHKWRCALSARLFGSAVMVAEVKAPAEPSILSGGPTTGLECADAAGVGASPSGDWSARIGGVHVRQRRQRGYCGPDADESGALQQLRCV